MIVGILGCGVVGKGVVELLEEKKIVVKRILVKTKEEIQSKRMTTDVSLLLEDKEIDVIVECMGGDEPAFSYVLQALRNGKHVVSSNKKMLSNHLEELLETAIAHQCVLRYEGAVGGGVSWIHELEHIKRIDTISTFKGIFNGTTNFILTSMMEQKCSFEAALKEAQALGYAEQDPTDDIEGYDTRSKVCLSILSAFGEIVSVEDIPVFGISSIQKEDIIKTNQLGYGIKLIGCAKKERSGISAYVIPMLLSKENLFAHVSKNNNLMEVNSNYLGSSMFYGQGAGRYPTAHAVVQDVLSLEDTKMMMGNKGKLVWPKEKKCFYVSTKQIVPTEWKQIGKHRYFTSPMTLHQILQWKEKCQDESIFVAEVEK